MFERIGDLLIQDQILTPAQLEDALNYQKRHGGRLGTCLIKLGLVSEQDVARILSRQYGVPALDLQQVEVPAAVLKLIPRETAERFQVLPLSRDGSSLRMAMADPTNVFALDDVKFMTGLRIEPVVACESAISLAIEKLYGGVDLGQDQIQKVMQDLDLPISTLEVETNEIAGMEEMEKAAEAAPVVRLVNAILQEALRRGASDIHVEPYERILRVRYRVDGVLQEVMTPPLQLRDAMISRIKIMARLDISEKRLPQDGRIVLRYVRQSKMKLLDLRVSILPTLFGEKVVMRLLDREGLRLDMTRLGFEPDALAKFQEAIHQPYGMVLVTGPTGSGKTNTLYSAISQLNTPDTNIMTAEDPVEFQLPGINQVQVKEQIGLNFAAALRSFLRQDPNIILVGEVRDFETAEIAVKAALTGHLVLSTLHTNDAPSTMTRLMNMGIEPFLAATSVNLVCAQRLIRRICGYCQEDYKLPVRDLIELGFSPEEAETVTPRRGGGCTHCHQTGYKGRVGLFEVMPMEESLRELVLAGASALELKRKAVENGMVTLRRSGLAKIQAGVSTVEEVLRETVR